MHLAVIDPATRVPELDCYNRISRRSRIPTTYHLPALQGVDTLAAGSDDIAGIVLFGSGANVGDGLPWQVDLEEWLQPRIRSGMPILGLCFGHQLLAKLFGGRVEALFEAKRAGLRDIHLVANPLWGEPRTVPLLVSHRQGVVALPDELEVVGHSDEVRVEAFAHRELPVWGFQSHPEATLGFVRNNSVPFDARPSVLTHGHALVDAFVARVATR